MNVVCFLLGNSRRLNFICRRFGTLCSIFVDGQVWRTLPPIKMEQTECSETSAYKFQKQGNYPEESIQQLYCSTQNSCSPPPITLQLYCSTHNSCSPLRVTPNHNCTVAFYPFLLAINFNIKTTIMVTSRSLRHHHSVTPLIPKLGTVWTVVWTPLPGQFTTGKDPTTNWVR